METIFDIAEVQKILLHRYPFLLIDKVIEFNSAESRLVAIKNVTINEQFFQGHFPGRPVMPGVLILEAMAQAAAIMAIKAEDGVTPGHAVMLVGADNVKWKRQVLPGDTLRIEVKGLKKRRPLWIIEGNVTVDGKVVASGQISAMEVA